MSLNRRQTLALLGGGTILAAGGAGAFAITRRPDAALAPWAQAGQYAEPRMRALSYAILAPNPHNRQPWLVELQGDDTVALHVDTDRLLPHTDPFSRQIVVGLGCFLEVMRLAAAEEGFDLDTELFPEGADPHRLDGRPVAVCRFRAGDVAPDPLFAQVLHRRTLKEPFDTERTVEDSLLRTVLGAARTVHVAGSVADEDIVYWRALTHEALRIEFETPRTYRESVDLFRIGRNEVNANPDGIDFSGPMFEAMALTGMFTRASALDTSSMAYSESLKTVFANTDTAMGHMWLVTDGNTRNDQIAAGRDWVRVNLACTAAGLGLQPLSQALQEYPEMAALYAEVHDRLTPEGGTVQMLARVGYGATVSESPRWPVTSKVVNA